MLRVRHVTGTGSACPGGICHIMAYDMCQVPVEWPHVPLSLQWKTGDDGPLLRAPSSTLSLLFSVQISGPSFAGVTAFQMSLSLGQAPQMCCCALTEWGAEVGLLCRRDTVGSNHNTAGCLAAWVRSGQGARCSALSMASLNMEGGRCHLLM